jgi:hypothetical protein
MEIRAGSEGQRRYGGRTKNGEDAVSRLLRPGEADGIARFRLIEVATDALVDGGGADPPTLLDRELGRPKRLGQAMDQIRGRLGERSVRARPRSRGAGGQQLGLVRGSISSSLARIEYSP